VQLNEATDKAGVVQIFYLHTYIIVMLRKTVLSFVATQTTGWGIFSLIWKFYVIAYYKVVWLCRNLYGGTKSVVRFTARIKTTASDVEWIHCCIHQEAHFRVCPEFVAGMDKPVKLFSVNRVQTLDVEFMNHM